MNFTDLGLNYDTILYSLKAKNKNIPIIFEEDGFLYSIEPFNGTCATKFRQRYSVIMDTENFYINARVPSKIERILNSEIKFTKSEISRAKKMYKYNKINK